MVALENLTAFSMDVKSCQKSGPRQCCPVHVDEERHPVVPWEGLHAVTMTKVVDPSPVKDHLGGAALVRLTETKPRERDLLSLVLCLQKNLWNNEREPCCDVDN